MGLPDGSRHRVAALSDKQLSPWGDFLMHDTGALLNDCRRMARAGGHMWRTTPLWGVRNNSVFLHDGSASMLEDAIAAHGGEMRPRATATSRCRRAAKSWSMR